MRVTNVQCATAYAAPRSRPALARHAPAATSSDCLDSHAAREWIVAAERSTSDAR